MSKQKKKKQKMNKGMTVLLVVLIFVCALAGALYIDTFHGSGRAAQFVTSVFQELGRTGDSGTQGQTQSAYSEKDSMVLNESTRAMVATADKQFFMATKDGMRFFAGMGEQKWSDTFNMITPQMVQEGNYVAAGEMGGKNIRVYDKNGLCYLVQTNGTIMQFALNANGYLSVITKENSAYRIQVYNGQGTLLKGRVEESDGVYPLCSDVSGDNRAFVVSYVDTTDIEPIARVLFFYINAQDSESYTDSMFAAVEKTDEVITALGYMKNGVVAAISDSNIYGFDVEGREVWRYALDNTLSHATLANDEHIVIALSDGALNAEGREKGLVCILDTAGREVATYATGSAVTYLKATSKGIMVGNDSIYTGLRYNGRMVWSCRISGEVADVIPMESISHTMIVTSGLAVTAEMKNGQNLAVIQENEGSDLYTTEIGDTQGTAAEEDDRQE